VTTRDLPLLSEQDGADFTFDFPDGLSELFSRAMLDPNHVEMPAVIAVCAQSISKS
jgi:hypothetical protein